MRIFVAFFLGFHAPFRPAFFQIYPASAYCGVRGSGVGGGAVLKQGDFGETDVSRGCGCAGYDHAAYGVCLSVVFCVGGVGAFHRSRARGLSADAAGCVAGFGGRLCRLLFVEYARFHRFAVYFNRFGAVVAVSHAVLGTDYFTLVFGQVSGCAAVVGDDFGVPWYRSDVCA